MHSYAHLVAVGLNNCSTNLQIPVHDEPVVHMLQPQYHLGCVEAYFGLTEDVVLCQVVVQVTAVHEVQDEAQLLWCLEGVCHADDEGAAVLKNKRKGLCAGYWWSPKVPFTMWTDCYASITFPEAALTRMTLRLPCMVDRRYHLG